jgi:aspartate aminotransferase
MKLATRLQAIKPSATLAQAARAKAMVAAGVDVISLVAGEPDFETPEFIKDAAIAAIRGGFTKYTLTAGTPELRTAICKKLEIENGLKYRPEQILVSTGAKHSVYNVLQALLDPGDEVIIFAPYWVSYPDIVRMAEGTPIIIETREEDGFIPDPGAVRRALSPRTRAMIINSPCNPSGAVFPAAALRAIAEVVRNSDCLLITDDIYEKLLYVPEPFVNIVNVAPDLFERTVVINGVSKAFAMTGWRLGYAAGPQPLINAMVLVQDQTTSNTSSITQKAATAALEGPKSALTQMLAEFRARRAVCISELNSIEGVRCRPPDGAFYAFPRVQELVGRKYKGRALTGSMQIADILLQDFHVAVVPGLPFGADGYLRLSFAASRQAIEEGIKRLRQFVAALS